VIFQKMINKPNREQALKKGTTGKQITTITNQHYKKAKAEFKKAFEDYALLMYKYNGVVYEIPELYYSEELAVKGEEQVQTAFYKEKIMEIEETNKNNK
jgi:hypothetical protein